MAKPDDLADRMRKGREIGEFFGRLILLIVAIALGIWAWNSFDGEVVRERVEQSKSR